MRRSGPLRQSLIDKEALRQCTSTGVCVLLVGFDGCEVRLCGLCAFVRPRVPCVSCVSRLPPVSFYRYP